MPDGKNLFILGPLQIRESGVVERVEVVTQQAITDAGISISFTRRRPESSTTAGKRATQEFLTPMDRSCRPQERTPAEVFIHEFLLLVGNGMPVHGEVSRGDTLIKADLEGRE